MCITEAFNKNSDYSSHMLDMIMKLNVKVGQLHDKQKTTKTELINNMAKENKQLRSDIMKMSQTSEQKTMKA